jgi:hypothetical protein
MDLSIIETRQCSNCGVSSKEVRLLRGRRFTVAMCDDCAVSHALVDELNREFRVIAVAVKSLVLNAS